MSVEPNSVECSDYNYEISHEKETMESAETVQVGNKRSTVENIVASSSKRLRRNQPTSSPLNQCLSFESNVEPPASPSSTTSGDATFEPTIDMMVNDFDDEQTLNEEEVMAALESQDPTDEIATLMEEGEMPLVELLAKYQSMPSDDYGQSNEGDLQQIEDLQNGENFCLSENPCENIVEEKKAPEHDNPVESTNFIYIPLQVDELGRVDELPTAGQVLNDGRGENGSSTQTMKVRHSHLLDLYPEEVFLPEISEEADKLNLELIYDDDPEDGEEIDDNEDNEYVKKTIMIGDAHQAVIPTELSKYGDVLPYENEDKLIWEPSQVSERLVEEYLLKVCDVMPKNFKQQDTNTLSINDKNPSQANCSSTDEIHKFGRKTDKQNSTQQTVENSRSNEEKLESTDIITGNLEYKGVIKDNEQALHLLVQCGYDFKEALRRKRLNAVPLTENMSIWSEEECGKFEEGIQKYGKDFFKIRQYLVRTRTMRELVQFYYFWKKSERRDKELPTANTIDHMEMYLNESCEYNTSAGSDAGSSSDPLAMDEPSLETRKHCNMNKNFSIMTGNAASTSSCNLQNSPFAGTSTTNKRKCITVSLMGQNTTENQTSQATSSVAN